MSIVYVCGICKLMNESSKRPFKKKVYRAGRRSSVISHIINYHVIRRHKCVCMNYSCVGNACPVRYKCIIVEG